MSGLQGISAICVYAIPDGESRKIADFGVYAVTATFSVFAYVWLVVVLAVMTPNVVTLWEALATFMMFPLLVMLSYCQDRNWFNVEKAEPTTGHIISKCNNYPGT